jgi:hypothetical protein
VNLLSRGCPVLSAARIDGWTPAFSLELAPEGSDSDDSAESRASLRSVF